MSKILIVEDEAKIARFVELELKHEGNETDKAADGRTALDMALENDYDLILLDVMLPGINGLEVLRRLRQKKDTPVIMLTARDAVMDKVAGLDSGADDYITKPFAIEELLARIRVVLKKNEKLREAMAAGNSESTGAGGITVSDGVVLGNSGTESLASPAQLPEGVMIVNGVKLDELRHEVTVEGQEIELTNREFVLLKTLMENKNIVLNREKLMNTVCGYDFVGETNVIDVYVRYLRTKIDDRFGIKLITTVRGVGYVIKTQD